MLSPVVRHYQQRYIIRHSDRRTQQMTRLRAVDRQTHREIHKHTPRQTNPTTDLHIITSGQNSAQTNIHRDTVRQTNTTDLHIINSGQSNAQTNIVMQRYIIKHPDRQTDRQTQRNCILPPVVRAVHRQTYREIQRYIIKHPDRQTNTTELHIITSGQNSGQTYRVIQRYINRQTHTEIH